MLSNHSVLVLPWYNDSRAMCVVKHIVTDAAQNGATDGAKTTTPHNNQINILFFCILTDSLSRTSTINSDLCADL